MALAPTGKNKAWSTPEYMLPFISEFASLTEKDIVMDCGCGDARVLIELAKSFGCRCIGYEISPDRLREARANIATAGDQIARLIELRDDNGLNSWLINDKFSFLWLALTARGLERVFKVLLKDQGFVPVNSISDPATITKDAWRITVVTFLYKLKSTSIKPTKTVWHLNPDNANSKYPMYKYEFVMRDFPQKKYGRRLLVGMLLGASMMMSGWFS
jgi:SAM-dependent methyltransferase